MQNHQEKILCQGSITYSITEFD